MPSPLTNADTRKGDAMIVINWTFEHSVGPVCLFEKDIKVEVTFDAQGDWRIVSIGAEVNEPFFMRSRPRVVTRWLPDDDEAVKFIRSRLTNDPAFADRVREAKAELIDGMRESV